MSLKLPAGHFYGETLGVRQVPGFRLTEVVYPPGIKLPVHSHELAKFCFVLSGCYTEILVRKPRVRKPSALVFQPSDIEHSELHEGRGHHFLIEIERSCLQQAREYSVALDGPVEVSGGAPAWLATKLYAEFRNLDGASSLAIQGLALELLAEASRRSVDKLDHRPPHWLEPIKEMLHSRFDENVPLVDLAAAAGVHPVHLARVFRKFHGCSVGEYVRQRRIEFACQQLRSSNASLADIAAAAGFSDQSHFSRTFKRLTGMLPTDYRHSFRTR